MIDITSDSTLTPTCRRLPAGLNWSMAAAALCLAPRGALGGFGSRDLEAMAAACVPLLVQDNASTYYEEALPRGRHALQLAEGDIEVRALATARAGRGPASLRGSIRILIQIRILNFRIRIRDPDPDLQDTRFPDPDPGSGS